MYCLDIFCSSILCLHVKTFQSLGKSNNRCLQCARPRARWGVFPLKNKRLRFFLKCDRGVFKFEETQESIEDITGDILCPEKYYSRQRCVYVHAWKEDDRNCNECLQYNVRCHFLKITFMDQKPTFMLFLAVMAHIALSK